MNRARITAIICVFLAAFCSAALINTVNASRELSRLTGEALALTNGGSPAEEELDALGDKISELSRAWEQCQPVISTYSRHDELERVSSAVRRLRPLLRSRKFDELYLTLHETGDALEHLRSTELPTISNIL